MRALALLPLMALLAGCADTARDYPDGEAQIAFTNACNERFDYPNSVCACLSERAAGRFDRTEFAILTHSLSGAPIRAEMEAAGLNSSVQGAISRFVSANLTRCWPETENGPDQHNG